MEYLNSIVEILKYPNENGILEFVLGVLFTLSVYHAFLFIQNKDKAYLYYALYTFLIVFGYVNLAENNFVYFLVSPYLPQIESVEIFAKFLYNAMYFIFAFEFMGLRKISKKWFGYIFYPLIFIVAVGTVAQVISMVTGDNAYIYNTFHKFFVPAIFIPTIVGYIALFKFPFIGKYYIIVGSFFLFITSMLGVFLYHTQASPDVNEIRFTIFYFGLIFENICFSLALGYKQKLVLEANQRKEKEYLQMILSQQEEERVRIAKELHDGVVQEVGSVILQMRNPTQVLKIHNETVISRLESINQYLRDVSHIMMPKALVELGLIAAIDDLLRTTLSYTKIDYEYDYYQFENRLTSEIEHNLYRISQELLRNIVRHSGCSYVSFMLIKKENFIVLRVEDDGIGFSKNKVKKGLGIDSVFSRVKILGGNISIDSIEKKGTTFVIKIPH